MTKFFVGAATAAALAVVVAALSLWPAKETRAASGGSLPGQQCITMDDAKICTFVFADGVRCMTAHDPGGMDAGPAVSVSCTPAAHVSSPAPATLRAE